MAKIIDVKKGIGNMYYAMSRFCRKQSEMIENDIENFEIRDLKTGYELRVDDGKKYQLICEFKEVKE